MKEILLICGMMLLVIPTVQAVDIYCPTQNVCVGSDLHKIINCTFDNSTNFYVDDIVDCGDNGCAFNMCLPPRYMVIMIAIVIVLALLVFAYIIWRGSR